MEIGIIALSIFSILLPLYFYFYIKKQDVGTPKMAKIASFIEEGATAYLKRQFLVLSILVMVFSIILAIFFSLGMAISYLLGAFLCSLASFLGMKSAVKTNVRVAQLARKGVKPAFRIAFLGGSITGFSIVGLALFGITLLFYLFRDLHMILGFSFGASFLALLAKAGGGIYTKTADISADLVGKVELGIPEDDPRNPAVIADNVGDNVGDVAGMAADLIDSYIASVIAAMILGSTIGAANTILPLLYAAAGLLASWLAVAIIIRKDPETMMNLGTLLTCVIFAVLALAITYALGVNFSVYWAMLSGLAVGAVMGITTNYFTSVDENPVRKIASSSVSGAALTILYGFSYGIMSIVPSLIGIAIATILAWQFAGVYGISMAAVGLLSIVSWVVSADAYGPIVDNSKGIAEQSKLPKKVIEVCDRLDSIGNTTKAVTKGFAIGAAALTVLSLFSAYSELVKIKTLSLMDPLVIAGLFIGAMMPPLLSALLILAVGKNSNRMIAEIRRQFREIPGLAEGKAKPDYGKCVDIATKGALFELMPICIILILLTLGVGFILGKTALAGYLAGSIITGIIFALFMANSGGAWDNAKKLIEAGEFGGKGSEAHKAAVIGDTVGDPFKDTAGPSLNTLITVMSLTASVFAPLISAFALM